jgi:hypothetical protein
MNPGKKAKNYLAVRYVTVSHGAWSATHQVKEMSLGVGERDNMLTQRLEMSSFVFSKSSRTSG